MSGSWEEFRDFLPRDASFHARGRVPGGRATPPGRGSTTWPPGPSPPSTSTFDPDLSDRSPGTLNVLWLVEECRRLGAPWLYLGYHVAGSPSMAYKAGFGPREILGDDARWR